MFHTKNKQGVVIHPTSVFASDPEVLHVPEDDTRETGKPVLQLQLKHDTATFLSFELQVGALLFKTKPRRRLNS